DRDQGVAKGVLAEDERLAHALGAGGADVLLAQDVQHRRTRGADENGGLEEAECDRGQQQRANPRPEPAGPSFEAARLHPAEPHGEEEDQQQPGPEGRDRDPDLREDHRDVVAGTSALPSVPMMRSEGSPGSTRTTTKTSTETKNRVATNAASLRTRYRRTPLRDRTRYYLAHATSERSADGTGRSFQIPWMPFFATTRRGCM